jgi:AbiV family abortive infection protein
MSEVDKFILQQKIGIDLSKQNANNLFNSAELLAANNYFSPAIPILILSAEETIKSFALCLEILLGSKSKVKSIIKESYAKHEDSYLNFHKDKHGLIEVIITDLKSISPFTNILKLLPLGDIKGLLNFLSISPTELDKIDSLLTKLKGFNDLKNEGFYVDNKNSRWHTPLGFNHELYNKVFTNINLIRTIFLPKIEYIQKFSENDLGLIYDIVKE